MIELTELKNGNLKISVSDKEEFENLLSREFTDERHYLVEMLDSGRYIGNDWEAPFNLGLTEVPAIAYGLQYDEEGELEDMEKLWTFDNYMIDSYLEELKNTGEVEFILHN